jgi:outer membrane protein OmpA-like peptidoglycan-associated protein
LGGLDVYVSYKRNGVFGKAINLGAPMNTMYDDFSLACDSTGRVGFIASNRPGGKGIDDIYFYIANYYFLAGKVRELGKNTIIPDAQVFAYNGNGELIDSARSDADGNFNLNLPFDQDYKIRGAKDGYETLNDMNFSTRGKPFGVDSLLLPMWKQRLFAKGKVLKFDTKEILPGATVVLNDLTNGTKDTVAINENGEYGFLIRPDKNYRIEASKEGYVTNGFDFETKGMLDGELNKDIILDEMYVERQTLYFAFNKMNVTTESQIKMDQIIRTLKATKDATLNIDAHADCRGGSTYNLGLSQRRANAAMQYIISKGINKSRLTAKGHGEATPVNQCIDGATCTEEEHSLNRRAEMKIQYKVPGKK